MATVAALRQNCFPVRIRMRSATMRESRRSCCRCIRMNRPSSRRVTLIPALTEASFARWWFFDAQAIHVSMETCFADPAGSFRSQGAVDLQRVMRFIIADAFAEAGFALNRGLDTPRIHAILAVAYFAFGNLREAAATIQIHILVLLEPDGSPVLSSDDSVKYFAALASLW